MDCMHDAVTVGWVVGAAAALGAIAGAAIIARRPSPARVAAGLALGLALTALTGLAASTDRSGTLSRTRRGLPHFFAVSNVDPETGADAQGTHVSVGYFLCDAALWCAASILFVALAAPGVPGGGRGEHEGT